MIQKHVYLYKAKKLGNMKFCHLTTSFWKCLSFFGTSPWILGSLGTQGYLCPKKRSRRSESRVFSPLLPLHVKVARCESFRNQRGMVCCDTPPTIIHVYDFYIRQFFGRRIQPFCNTVDFWHADWRRTEDEIWLMRSHTQFLELQD